MGDVDDKLFKEYSDGKDFNSFINEFVVEELKDMGRIEISRIETSEYISKLFNIVNATDYFLYEYCKK